MLNVSRLLCGTATPGDTLRYGEPGLHPRSIRASGVHHRPVVVWNITRSCNLRCIHCYASATAHRAPDELSHDEASRVVEDLAAFGVPVILFSGGEPLMRTDLFDLMTQAYRLGIQPVLSSNGTLINAGAVQQLRAAGVHRVGISLDGMETTHDQWRQQQHAFQEALAGIRRLLAEDFRVSLRFTVAQHNVADVEPIFDLCGQEGIPRICVYHLAYAGRGKGLSNNDLDNAQRRDVVDFIFARTLEWHRQGKQIEVLTVDNQADGPYLLLWAQRHAPERVPEIARLLQANGGDSAGIGIGCIDERGYVHPDQFWRTCRLGNVRERPFSAIWSDPHHALLSQLRNRKPLLSQRCQGCRFLAMCNGNLRTRGEVATGDTWGHDPACYLSDAEIALDPANLVIAS